MPSGTKIAIPSGKESTKGKNFRKNFEKSDSRGTEAHQFRISHLPTSIARKIEAAGQNEQVRSRLISLSYAIMRARTLDGRTPFEYVPIPVNYLEKILGSNYHLIVAKALELNIIERNDYYHFNLDSPGKGHCKSYRLIIERIDEELAPIQYVAEERLLSPQEWAVKENFEHLTIDEQDAMDRSALYILNEEWKRKVQPREKIPADLKAAKTVVNGRGIGTISVQRAFEIADRNEMTVNRDGKRLKLDKPGGFERRKRIELEHAHQKAIRDIKSGNFFQKTGANGRLFSTITTFPSILRPSLRINGQKVASIDLSNSQLLGLSKGLGKEEGYRGYYCVTEFQELASSGEIYEKVQAEMGLETRDEAKLEVFRALFSSHRAKNMESKRALCALFPEESALFDQLKQGNGKAHLANMMQEQESKVFMRIFTELTALGIVCFPCHDSIFCAHGDVEIVTSVMNDILSEEYGKFKLKTTYY